MGFWKKEKSEPEYALAAVIDNPVNSAIFQDLLKNNDIPFVCRQQGAGGYIKILTGGLLAPDNIYVSPRDLDRATELYRAYVACETPFDEAQDDSDELGE